MKPTRESLRKQIEELEEQLAVCREELEAFAKPGTRQSAKTGNDGADAQQRLEQEIVGRERAEKALEAKTEELDRYFTNSLDLLCIADMDGYFRRLSREWENTLGYPVSHLEGMKFLDLVHPDDVASTLDALKRLTEQGAVQNFPNRYKRSDGSYRWLEWRSFREGELIYAAARDITERKLIEDELRSSGEKLQSILRAVPTGIGLVVNRVIREANERLCEMTGYSKEELLEQSARILYPTDEDFDFVGREKYLQIARRGTGTVETRWRRKDGTIINVLLSSTPLDPADQSLGVTFTVLDITERKRAEEQLRVSERKYRNIFENAVEGIFQSRPEGDYVGANPALARIYGYDSPEDLIASVTDISKQIYVDPEDRARLGRIVEGYGFVEAFESLQRRKNGTVIWTSSSARAVRDEGGKVIYYEGTVVDITDRRRVEEALRESEKKFRDIAELAPQIIYEMNADGRLTFVNKEAFRLLGYTEEDFAAGINAVSLFPPDEYAKVRRNLQGIAEQGVSRGNEYTMAGKDGRLLPVIAYSAPILKDGQPAGFRGVLIDITERKRAEEVLRESEERLQTIFEESPYAIALNALPGGEYVDVNRAFCEANGVGKEFILGKTIEGLGLLQDKVVAQRLAERLAVEGRIDREELRVRLLTGEIRTVLASVKLVTIAGKPLALSVMEDISERKEAELRLRESEERFQTMFNESPYSICLNEVPGGVFVDVNRHFCEVNGVAREAVIGKTAVQLGSLPNPENPDWVRTRLMRDGRIDWEEVQVRRLTGDTITALMSSRLIALGGRLYALTMIQDISERKKADAALQESEQRFRTLFESAADALLLLKESIFVDCNDSAQIVFGCTKEQLLGQPPYRFSPPVQPDGMKSREKAFEKVAAALSGTPQFFEWKHCRWDGTPFDAEISLTRIEIGGEPYIQASVRDVTARKRTEEELRRLSVAIEQAAEEIMVLDLYGVIEYVNPAFERITGYSRSEALGRNVWSLKGGVHELEFYERLRTTLGRGEVWAGRMMCRRKDGEPVQQDGTISPLLASRGEHTGYISLMKDITDEMRLEAQLRQAQKVEVIGQLAGGVAHDFNNILSALMGYGSLLQMKMTRDDPLRTYVDQILLSTEKAANLTQSLLAFSRKQIINPKPIGVNETVAKMEKLLARLLTEDIELKKEVSPERLVVMADASQIDQVLMNLVTNAKDAMPRGGTMVIKTERFRMGKDFIKAHGFGRPGEYACISVSDTGAGMDEKTQERIFEPFFTTKETGRGTGLGLSIVYGIVKQHNGYIVVSSEIGRGTTFTVYLPLIRGPAHELKEERRAMPRGTERVLCVEDEPQLRALITMILREHGYDISEAENGLEAVRKFSEGNFDLVILDVVMPKMNGWDAYLAMEKARPHVRALFISGYTDDIIHQKGILDEKLDFLTKPVGPSELLVKVRQVLDRQ